MEYYLSLITFTFVAGITPGPNNMMLMASGLNHGIRKSMPHYLGICLGFPVMVSVVGFGLGTVFTQYPRIYFYMKIFGIVYLLYLAWKIANAGHMKAGAKVGTPFSFLQAAAFQWLNPKAWAIAIGALATFTAKEGFVQSMLIVILVYFVMGFLCMGVWLKLGQSLQVFLHTHRRVNIFNIAMASLLVLSIIPMALTSLGTAI